MSDRITTMTDYRIVCTEQTSCTRYGHIESVGSSATGGGTADQSWTVLQVWAAMDRGDRFYTHEDSTTALVDKYRCGCGLPTLRSTPDATKANNLDSLRICRWMAA